MRLFVASMALPALAAASSKGTTTAVPATTFYTAQGLCECEGYCIIDSQAECEAAAVTLGLGDTDANVINRSRNVRGCSVNSFGGLRINLDLTSTKVHPDGSLPNDPRLVVCKSCGSGGVTAGNIDLGLCQTTEAPTTEEQTTEAPTTQEPTTEAPTTQEPTTEAPTTQEPTTEAPTTQEPTTEAPTTEEPTTESPTTEEPTTESPTTQELTTPCSYATARTLCECEGLHTLTSLAECEEAAAVVGHSDLTANPTYTPGFVAGCAINAGQGLRFNADLTSTKMHNTFDPDQVVLCSTCKPEATTPVHAVCLPAFALADGGCDGEAYCTVTDGADCDLGATFLNLADTTHTEVNNLNSADGCHSRPSGLEFNPNGDPNTEHGINDLSQEICVLCPATK